MAAEEAVLNNPGKWGPYAQLALGAGILFKIWWDHSPQATRMGIKNDIWTILEALAEGTRQDHLSSPPTLPHVVDPDPRSESNVPVTLPPVGGVAAEIDLSAAIGHPAVTLIFGRRGSGKTALGLRMLELNRAVGQCYVVGWNKAASHLLPEWIGTLADLRDLPPNSVALIDEAYLSYHALDRSPHAAKELSTILNLSRQRRQSLIFIGQEARQLDRYIVSAADAFLIREPGALQSMTERRELAEIVTRAGQAISNSALPAISLVYAYVPGSDFEMLVAVTRPSFWDERMSTAFAAGGDLADNSAGRGNRAGMAKRAKELLALGWSYADIGKELGVSKSTAYNLANDYPYA